MTADACIRPTLEDSERYSHSTNSGFSDIIQILSNTIKEKYSALMSVKLKPSSTAFAAVLMPVYPQTAMLNDFAEPVIHLIPIISQDYKIPPTLGARTSLQPLKQEYCSQTSRPWAGTVHPRQPGTSSASRFSATSCAPMEIPLSTDAFQVV